MMIFYCPINQFLKFYVHAAAVKKIITNLLVSENQWLEGGLERPTDYSQIYKQHFKNLSVLFFGAKFFSTPLQRP